MTQNAWHLYMFRYDPAGFSGMSRARFLEALRADTESVVAAITKVQRYSADLRS